MSTVNRTINTEHERDMAARLVENRPVPFTLTVTDGKHRTTAQNRLINKWYGEVSEQKGDMSAKEVRAYCKLTIGVPILRAQNEAFRIRYDEVLKPLSYEQKIAIMSEPLNLPVTSLMNTKQLTEYLDGIARHFGEQGIILTMPEDMRNEIYSNSDDIPSSEDTASPVVSEPKGSAPSHASGSSISDETRLHLMDFARKSLRAAGEGSLSDQNIEDMIANYREVLPESDWGKLSTIKVALMAVKAGKRTVDQARSFIATDCLDCSVEEIGGVK